MAHEKLLALKCWPMVEQRLKNGDYLETIAAWIQEEQEEYTDVHRASVVRNLNRYRTEELGITKDMRTPSWMMKKLEGKRRGLNEVDELEKLYLLQMERISIGMELEERLKITNRHLAKEVAVARDILARMADLKMELGVYSRTPAELHLTAGNPAAGRTLQHLEEMAPERRQRITAVAAVMLDQLKLTAGEEIPAADADVVAPSDPPEPVPES